MMMFFPGGGAMKNINYMRNIILIYGWRTYRTHNNISDKISVPHELIYYYIREPFYLCAKLK